MASMTDHILRTILPLCNEHIVTYEVDAPNQ